MKSLLVKLIAAVSLFCASGGFGQADKATVVVTLSALNPLGSFADPIGDDARTTRRFGFQYGKQVGLASIGTGVGVEFHQPIYKEKVAWLLSSRILVNPTNVEKITDFFQHELGDSVSLSFDNGTWINIPIFTGFAYRWPVTSAWSVLGSLQAGLNITRQASRKTTVQDRVVEQTNFSFTPDFGFEAGLTAEWHSKIQFGVHYLNLGSPRYEGIRKLDPSYYTTIPKREMNVDGDERAVSMLLFTFGYRF